MLGLSPISRMASSAIALSIAGVRGVIDVFIIGPYTTSVMIRSLMESELGDEYVRLLRWYPRSDISRFRFTLKGELEERGLEEKAELLGKVLISVCEGGDEGD